FVEAGTHALAIADHDDAVVHTPPAVSARQDRRHVSMLTQETRDVGDDGRFSTAADNEIADADHGAIETAHGLRMARVPRAPQTRDAAVDSAERVQWTRRKGRTTAGRRPDGGNRSPRTFCVLSFAPRLASTSARAAAPSFARRTGSPHRLTTTSSSSRAVRT